MAEGFDGDHNGIFIEQSPTFDEVDRGYYRHETIANWCLWWHKPYNHWWMGHCGARGQNNGHSYLEPSPLCPHEAKKGPWRRGGSDEEILGASIKEATDKDIIDEIVIKKSDPKAGWQLEQSLIPPLPSELCLCVLKYLLGWFA